MSWRLFYIAGIWANPRWLISAARGRPPERNEMSNASKVILICDDNLDILNVVSMIVRGAGYEVKSASSHKELLTILETCQPDLLISDIRMPGRDGFWIAEYLQSQNINIPIIFMTAYDSSLYRAYAPFVGSVGFVTKPLDIDELLRQITRGLEARRPEPALIEAETIVSVPETDAH
jgi:CheY-like chemotaxis protein